MSAKNRGPGLNFEEDVQDRGRPAPDLLARAQVDADDAEQRGDDLEPAVAGEDEDGVEVGHGDEMGAAALGGIVALLSRCAGIVDRSR